MSKSTRAVIYAFPFLLCCLPILAQSRRADSLERQLFAAIGNRNLVAVEHALEQGADIESKATNGVTPLMTAAEAGSVPIVSLLLEHGANAGAKDDQGETALTWAARGGWLKLVSFLARFSDTKAKNSALFAGVESGPVSIEIDVSTLPTPPQSQPTEVEESWTETVESLLDSGADIESRNEDGSTPLIWAASFAQADVLKLLLSRGAMLNVRDKSGNTPLTAAACQCAVATMNSADEVIKILLDTGADVNARNHDGDTALMMASGMTGDASILKLLLDHGADLRARNKDGQTALAIAKQARREDKIQVLKKAYSQMR